MNITTLMIGSTATIHVRGKFDSAALLQFNAVMLDAVGNPLATTIEVDMREVIYIDSAACGCLLRLKSLANASRKSVSISNATGSVKQALEMMNFRKLFRIT